MIQADGLEAQVVAEVRHASSLAAWGPGGPRPAPLFDVHLRQAAAVGDRAVGVKGDRLGVCRHTRRGQSVEALWMGLTPGSWTRGVITRLLAA